jgi:serine/threonine protein phosphatase PrpC
VRAPSLSFFSKGASSFFKKKKILSQSHPNPGVRRLILNFFKKKLFSYSKQYKTNQDSFLAVPHFHNEKSKLLFGVLDGHGTNGHYVSRFISNRLPGMLAEWASDLQKDPGATLKKAFLKVDQELQVC